MIPEEFQVSNYPDSLDSNVNLYEVHDHLRVKLINDYDPNDNVISNRTKIYVSGDISNFPSSGIITLTDQCNDSDSRAISFFYTNKGSNTFEGLSPTPEFENKNIIIRSKNITFVTQNVMAQHHNSIKDAIIAIEEFVGIKGNVDEKPFGETMEGRINFLRKLVLSPKAWFSSDLNVGLVPLTVKFKNESFRLGEDSTNNNYINFIWDFGDQTTSNIETISVSETVPISYTDVYVSDIDSGFIEKTYTKAGNYTVKLKAINEFGEDEVIFENFINARIESPQEAIINIAASSKQTLIPGSPVGGPYVQYPKIRTKTDEPIVLEIQNGINLSTGRSYGGEELDVWGNAIDPIEYYTWQLNDDLEHINDKTTKAIYSMGGIYDISLRCDTQYGAYKITNYFNSIDVIEDKNLWLFKKNGSTLNSNEFGLISETFKTSSINHTIIRDSSFLDDTNNEIQAKREFDRNVGFTPNTNLGSGSKGNCLVYYAEGGDEFTSLSSQKIKFINFNGFNEVFFDESTTISRPWNWIGFPIEDKIYFILGVDPTSNLNENKSYQTEDVLNINGSMVLEDQINFINPNNFINGANEIIEHITSNYIDGEPENGRFAVYRSAVRNNTGYFLRNDGVGTFFKIKEFYRTEGTVDNPVTNIRKLQDVSGTVKLEGQLVNLNNGLFFFNNSGNISAYNVIDNKWEIGSSSSPFRALQDKSVSDYNNVDQTLLATSDNERNAYISYDYSTNAFVRYNSIDKTFYALNSRPSGNQWLMGIY